MSIVCRIDQSVHESIEMMHNHLRKLKVTQKKYYEEFIDKRDLLTNEKIQFKNTAQYESTSFLNKNNLKKWLKLNPEKGKEWAINWLSGRKTQKSLEYPPCEVELQSLMCPTMKYYDSIGGYYDIAKKLGFKQRYTDEPPIYTNLPANTKIVQDSREQDPLLFDNYPTIVQKLDCGDYGLDTNNDTGVYIERKSIGDFVGTLSDRKNKDTGDSNFQRFKRQLERAAKNDSYIIMLVENNLNKCLSVNYNPLLKRYIKTSSAHLFKNLRDLFISFPLNFQALFCEGRQDAKNKVISIFRLGAQVRNLDLQYLSQKGAL